MNRAPFCLALFLSHSLIAASGAMIAIDPAGNIWKTGSGSIGTTPDAFQRSSVAGICGTQQITPFFPPMSVGCSHSYVTKQDATGKILYATFIAGSTDDGGTAITTDAAGNVYVTGFTYSSDFPVTANAFQKKNAGPLTPELRMPLSMPYGPEYVVAGGDAFVAKFASDGTLVYSTLLGGSGDDIPTLIAVDASGSAYVAGTTTSADFPVTSGAFTAQSKSGSFFARLDPQGAVLIYGTRSDPTITGFDVDAQGGAYLTGLRSSQAPYVDKIDAAAQRLVYSTLLPSLDPKYGGPIPGFGGGFAFGPTAILVTPSGSVLLGLNTEATTTGPGVGFGDILSYLLQLAPDGGSVLKEYDYDILPFDSIHTDAAGNFYIFGQGGPALTGTPLLASACAASTNPLVLELDPTFQTQLAATHLRQGGDTALQIPSPGHLIVYRGASDATIPVDLTAKPAMNFGCAENLASGEPGPGLAGGEVFAIFGNGIGPATGIAAVPNAAGQYPTSLGGVQVLIDGNPVPLLYAQAGEIHGITPFYLPDSVAEIVVQYNGQSGPPLDAGLVAANPAIFTIGKQGAILNQDGTVNTPANPAKLGSIVSIYATGTGPLSSPLPDGSVTPIPPPFITLATKPTVTFDNIGGTVLWAGAAPGLVAGVGQINVRLPTNLQPNPILSAVGVSISMNANGSPGGVFISVMQ